MQPRLVPECEFHSIADADFVVDDAEIIANDVLGHAKLLGYFSILESLRDQLNHMLLARTGLAIVFADNIPPSMTLVGGQQQQVGGSEGRVGRVGTLDCSRVRC